jgi:hypothetical protein
MEGLDSAQASRPADVETFLPFLATAHARIRGPSTRELSLLWVPCYAARTVVEENR